MPRKKKTTNTPEFTTTTLEPILRLNSERSAFITPIKNYDNCEWCFQFNDDKPHVFAASNGKSKEGAKISFTLSSASASSIMFKDGITGMEFKLFAREKTT